MQEAKVEIPPFQKKKKFKNHNLLHSFALDFSKFNINIKKKILEDLDFAAITVWSKKRNSTHNNQGTAM